MSVDVTPGRLPHSAATAAAAEPAAGPGLFGRLPGRYAAPARSRWWSPVRVLLALTVLACLLGWLQKAPCRTHPWTDDYQYSRLCYSDVYALYFSEGLSAGKTPYVSSPVEYPVLIGGAMEVAAKAVSVLPPQDRPAAFFDVTALLLTGAALVVTVTTARLLGARRWAAAMFAVAPTLVMHAFTNWDLLAVALAGLGLLAWARGSPTRAGIWLGLGAATKLYPALLLVPLVLLCVRAGRWRAGGRVCLAAAAAWAVVNLPIAVLYPSSWGRFWALNRSRAADWDSLWFVLERGMGRPDLPSVTMDLTTLNLLVAVLLLLGLVGVAALALLTPRAPRVGQLAFLTVAVFLLTNKVYSPQYVLWLVPLAVLARPRWPAFLLWQAAEVAVVLLRFPMFMGQSQSGQGVPLSWFLYAVVLRDLTLALLCVLVVRDILQPGRDVVRTAGLPDPAAGPVLAPPAPHAPAPDQSAPDQSAPDPSAPDPSAPDPPAPHPPAPHPLAPHPAASDPGSGPPDASAGSDQVRVISG